MFIFVNYCYLKWELWIKSLTISSRHFSSLGEYNIRHTSVAPGYVRGDVSGFAAGVSIKNHHNRSRGIDIVETNKDILHVESRVYSVNNALLTLL